jgi:hypothetical protein
MGINPPPEESKSFMEALLEGINATFQNIINLISNLIENELPLLLFIVGFFLFLVWFGSFIASVRREGYSYESYNDEEDI